MIENEKCVVVISGGVDSSTVAFWAKNQGYHVHGLSFRYGQIAAKEVDHAQLITQQLGIPLKTLDLTVLKDIYVGVTSLCDETIEMTSEFSQPIIVPFRNAIFLSIAVAYAASIDATQIFYGAQGSDRPFYPDCRTEFYKAFETAARLGTKKEITIDAPFNTVSKAETIKRGAELGVPYQLTWSCYFDGAKHCGTCESCMNRKKAFEEAEIKDPTEYFD